MKIILLRKKLILYLILLFLLSLVIIYIIDYIGIKKKYRVIIGATLSDNEMSDDILHNASNSVTKDFETFFRPSCEPVLNTKDVQEILNTNSNISNYSQVKISNDIFINQENMILYYYSILRDAYNLKDGLGAGCGSLGISKDAYMIAYNFLSNYYMKQLPYNDYYNSFKNILHINLVKLIKVQNDLNDTLNDKYLIELETIQGTKDNSGAFVYYYGYIYVSKQDELYKINNVVLYPEIYLCAPYHGWSYSAENVIDIEYGGWCSMVKEKYDTKFNGYIKSIEFKSFDDKTYVIKFITLTNDTDIQIGQYIKDENGNLKETYIDVKSCIEDTNKKNN